MKLRELAEHRYIVIQCHDVPDADSICSGFALQCYLRSLGAEAVLVYGGAMAVSKPSLMMLVEMLHIELEHITELPPQTELLITVDCQRGAGNVQSFALPQKAEIAVIDHHRAEIPEGDNVVIRHHLASCSTLVWDLMRAEGYIPDSRVLNALYYGLYTDTNGLSELRHPLDRDLAEISYDSGMIRKLKNASITIDELDIMGSALQEREVMGNIGMFRAKPCDANLLGFTSDVVQQVANLDCCVVYCHQKHGLKLSIRSSSREIMASEIASFLCGEAGSGGGNIEKAGGFMSFAKISDIAGDIPPENYLRSRVGIYLNNYDLIYAGENDIDFKSMPLYKKLPRPVGYAVGTDVFPVGTKITVRTLEGDIDTVISEDIYFMIGIQGEVYPIKRERFDASYRAFDDPYTERAEYHPVILNRITGERRELPPFAKTCVPGESKVVRAKVLEKDAKVFSFWDTEKYFFGSKGDYLAANEDNYDDCYIIRKDIFLDSYIRVER